MPAFFIISLCGCGGADDKEFALDSQQETSISDTAEADGERLFFGIRKLAPGWSLMVTNKIPDTYTMENPAVKLTWEDGGKNADGAYPSVLIAEFGGQCTADELRASGMVVWDEHYGTMLETRTTYGSGSSTDLNAPGFGLFFELYFYGADRNVLPGGLSSQLTFFAGDGTPLEEYFEGYSTLEITIMINMFDVMLIQDGEAGDKTQNEGMCDELKACEPYLLYTGLDGSQQRFDLLTEE